MSTVVLVHGIAQTQEGADTLEATWIAALASGIRKAGYERHADALSNRPGPGLIGTRMSFYADLFQRADAQGPAGEGPEATRASQTQLVIALLSAAAERAPDPRDRAESAAAVKALNEANSRDDSQGWQALVRPTFARMVGLRWFAPMALQIGGPMVWSALREVTTYMDNPDIRAAAQDRVLALITPQTRLVIGHSLGSVVAFEALHRLAPGSEPLTFLTLGSPLGLKAVIHDKLQPRPVTTPPAAASWSNFNDRDDLIAAVRELSELFPARPGFRAQPRDILTLDNGAKPHDATHYLVKRSVGTAAAAALT